MTTTPSFRTTPTTPEAREKPDPLASWALITAGLSLLGITWFLLATYLPYPVAVVGVIFQQLTMPSGPIALILGILAFKRARHADGLVNNLGIAALIAGILGFAAVATFFIVAISGFATNG